MNKSNHKIKIQQENGEVTLYFYEKCVVIANLKVDKSHRGNGIGTKLMAEATRVAHCLTSKILLLRVDKNSWMVEWYKRLGFIYYSPDEVSDKYIWLSR